MNRICTYKTLLGVFIICSLLVAGTYLYEQNDSLRETIALATTVKPETFTELYFTDHLHLPKDLETNTTNHFQFTVHNLEYKDMIYPYEVYIDSGANKDMLKKGSFTLKQNAYKTIEVDYDFLIPPPFTRAKVVVNLINKKQQIDFWIGGDAE